jgi:hypothetical protein
MAVDRRLPELGADRAVGEVAGVLELRGVRHEQDAARRVRIVELQVEDVGRVRRRERHRGLERRRLPRHGEHGAGRSHALRHDADARRPHLVRSPQEGDAAEHVPGERALVLGIGHLPEAVDHEPRVERQHREPVPVQECGEPVVLGTCVVRGVQDDNGRRAARGHRQARAQRGSVVSAHPHARTDRLGVGSFGRRRVVRDARRSGPLAASRAQDEHREDREKETRAGHAGTVLVHLSSPRRRTRLRARGHEEPDFVRERTSAASGRAWNSRARCMS